MVGQIGRVSMNPPHGGGNSYQHIIGHAHASTFRRNSASGLNKVGLNIAARRTGRLRVRDYQLSIITMFLSSMGQGIQISVILVYFIFGGIAADSPPQQESFSEIIRFPLFSYESVDYLKGTYFTKLRLGNPPQELNVVVDTGSDPTWVNCRNNEMIGTRDYVMEHSVTASLVLCSHGKKPCPFHINYYDSSFVSGVDVRDSLNYEIFQRNSSAANLSSSVVFGCINHRNDKIRREIEGILGLGPGKRSIIAQLSSQHIAPQVFSLCLASRGGGFLILGQVLDKGLVYTPLVSKSNYKIAIESIAVNEEMLAIDYLRVFQSEHGTFVDSGAQISVLVAEAYDSLLNAVSNFLKQAPILVGPFGTHCYLISASQIYPTLHFKFSGGATMSLTPIHYLFEDDQGRWCIKFRSVQDVNILGAPALSDKIIVYDLIHLRIGWVKHDCSETVNVSLIYDVGNQATRSCSWKMAGIVMSWFTYYIFIQLEFE